MFRKMINENIREPDKILEIQKRLEEKHAENTKNLPPEKKLQSEERFSDFLTQFGKNLAHMSRDVSWDNEINTLAKEFERKKESLTKTYQAILSKEAT